MNANARMQMISTRSATTAAPSKTSRPFRFLDLPAELRNHVYILCLTCPSGFQLCSDFGEHGEFVRLILPLTLEIKLLLVSRQINREATGILYGENRFQSSWHYSDDPKFLSQLPGVRHIRDIQLSPLYPSDTRVEEFLLLKGATSLNRLAIRGWDQEKPEWEAEFLWRLVHELQKRRGGYKKPVLDILEFPDRDEKFRLQVRAKIEDELRREEMRSA